jgi:hypothetical protein
MRLIKNITLALCLTTAGAHAGMMDDSLQKADQWWGKTRQYADSAYQATISLWREDDAETQRLWDDLTPQLDEILGLRDRQPDLPAWSWMGEDRQSNQETIDGLFDEAARILIGDEPYRAQLREIEQATAEQREKIAELKRQKLLAPDGSVWRKTVQDIDDEIAEHQAYIEAQQTQSARIREQFATKLQQLGLDIQAGQLDFLLSTVVGDEVVDMARAFAQVRTLAEQLETLTADSHEDLKSARRYYGIYMVLLQLLDHMQGNLAANINDRYLPRIENIERRARRLNNQTLLLQAEHDNPVLQANLQAQRLTLQAAGRYRDYLLSQRRQVLQARERLSRDLAVAQNTYETVKVSGDLVSLMKHSRHLIDTLFTLQAPPLRAFENLEMKREFERLTQDLQAQAES